MEGWTDADAAFFKYSSCRDGRVRIDPEEEMQISSRFMSLFQVKCALLALFGEEIPTVSPPYMFRFFTLFVKTYLFCEQVSIKQALSHIDTEWQTCGIGKHTFMELQATYNKKSEQEIVFEVYKEFDKMNRGFISSTDFMNVVGQVLPHLSRRSAERIFRAADLYQVEKVCVCV